MNKYVNNLTLPNGTNVLIKDSECRTNLSNEIRRATAKETELEDTDTNLRNDLTTETNARKQSDTALQQKINAEVSSREQGDNKNNAEIAKIHSNITGIENKNNEQDNEISTLRTMLSSPYNFKGKVSSISALPASGQVNDTYYVQDVKYKVTWNGSEWVQSSLSEADYQTELSELNVDLSDISNILETEYNLISNKASDFQNGYWENNAGNIQFVSNNGTYSYPRINIKAGKTYSLIGVYGYFTWIKSSNSVTRVSNKTSNFGLYTIQPKSDCELYITINKGKFGKCAVIEGNNSSGSENADYGLFIPDNSNANKFNSITRITNYIKKDISLYESNSYYTLSNGNLINASANDVSTYKIPVLLSKGVTYTFNKIYGYFCYYTETNDESSYHQLTNNNSNQWSGTFTPSKDVYLYITVHNNYLNSCYIINSTERSDVFTENKKNIVTKIEGLDITPHKILVSSDGDADFTSVVDAVNYANDNYAGIGCDIIIREGNYDILYELGGDTWLSSISASGGERQGLHLKENINIIGDGNVLLTFLLPDNNQVSSYVSLLNLWESNKIENISMEARNCRYVIHDETNGGNSPLKRVIKNCRLTHLGNKTGMWNSPTCYGGGCGGNGQYDFINSTFIAKGFRNAWTFHTNYFSRPSYFNVDGCVGISNNNDGFSFKCSYHGNQQVGKTVFHFKCCTGNALVGKVAETSGSNDNIEMYNNGYVQDVTLLAN